MREGKARMSETVEYGVRNPVWVLTMICFLKNYRILATNVIPFGHRTADGFHSELRLYERQRD